MNLSASSLASACGSAERLSFGLFTLRVVASVKSH